MDGSRIEMLSALFVRISSRLRVELPRLITWLDATETPATVKAQAIMAASSNLAQHRHREEIYFLKERALMAAARLDGSSQQ